MKVLVATLLLSGLAAAQTPKTVRVFLTDQQSWADASNLVLPAHSYAPSRTEQVHNLAKYCPAVTITAEPTKADFILNWTSISYEQNTMGRP
jgi:hypothetical protein